MYDDTIVTVDSIEIEHLDQDTNVYNFEVENAHTYYVTDKGILVHNLCAGSMVDDVVDEGFLKCLNDDKYGTNYEVYKGITKNSDDVYTGITRQGIEKRLTQHQSNGKPFVKLKRARSFTKNLTRNQARAIEQYYIIDYYKKSKKCLNEINSISNKFKYYDVALVWAERFLVK